MHHVALNVIVERKTPIEWGIRIRIRSTSEEARASLERVLEAHSAMLTKETGWEMGVEENDAACVLRVSTEEPNEVAKIRGLGNIGLLSHGAHHQPHHWLLVQRDSPHSHTGE